MNTYIREYINTSTSDKAVDDLVCFFVGLIEDPKPLNPYIREREESGKGGYS